MELNNQDWATIEEALRQAVHSGTDYRKAMNYKSVLTKLQAIHPNEMGSYYKAPVQGLAASAADDGIRYDYDDSSDLYK